jgi:two-component sensor histidine kinase
MTDALRSQGQLYWDRQKYDSALAAYEEGMGIARTHQMPLAYARLAGNLSYVFMRQRSYERMRDTLQGVLAEFRKAGIVHEIADAEIDLALAYRELHDYGMSIALAEQGLATAQAKGLRSRERFALGLLADTYELQGDIRTANRYRKEISVHMQEATEDQLRRYYYAVEALDASEHRNQLARWQLLRLEETRRLALVVLAASAVVIVLLSLRFIHKRRTARVLQAQSHLIAEQNDTLGRQVQALDAARTELRTLNESLEAQVRNRTAALQLESDEHRRTAEELTRSLREKEVLLREIHHRVKNNLQVMSSLLNLQAGKIPDPEERRPFLESIGRIRSMALVHEVLYQTSDFAQLDFASYLERLVRLLQSAYAAPEVQSRLRLEKVHLPLDLAVPCALIVNELVSNAFKHAFPDGRKGVVTTAVRVLEDGKTELSVEDNGIGIPPEAMRNDGKSLGMFLVRILTDQILGTLTLDQSHGTTFRIQFPPEQD